MIYDREDPYFTQDFGIGKAMFKPSGEDGDRAVMVLVCWNEGVDEEEVDQRLETWAGLPCLPWFRHRLTDAEDVKVANCSRYHTTVMEGVHGYLSEDAARDLKTNSIVYFRAYGDRARRDG